MKVLGMMAMAISMTMVTMAQEQTTPPAPSAPREVSLPKAADRTLGNGMRVIVVQKKGAPIVAARLMIKAGAEADPSELAGLADLTATLLTKGTSTHNAKEIAEGVEALGATLNSTGAWDVSTVDLNVMSVRFPQALAFVADVVRNPAFANDEVERQRTQNIDSLKVGLRQPATLAHVVASRVVYGDAPYGHNLGGTPKTMLRITRDDIVGFHQQHYRPSDAVLVVAGDVSPSSVFASAQKLFGDWKNPSNAKAVIQVTTPASAGATPSSRVVVIDLPEAGQAAVVVTKQGLRRADPAYNVSHVANSILGAGYSSRLNEEIRIKRGLSYGASSNFELRRQAGPFGATVQTKNESAAEVAGLIVDELNKMGAAPAAESELGPRKATIIGAFGRSLETSLGLVSRVSSLALYGLIQERRGD